MKNYEEKEKKLENVLNKLNLMSNKVGKMNKDINSLIVWPGGRILDLRN